MHREMRARKIVLTYTIAKDTQEQVEFKKKIAKIDLSNRDD